MQTLSSSDISEITKAAFISKENSESITYFIEPDDRQNWIIINLESSSGVHFPRIKILMRHARKRNVLEKKLLNIRGALEDIGYQFKPWIS